MSVFRSGVLALALGCAGLGVTAVSVSAQSFVAPPFREPLPAGPGAGPEVGAVEFVGNATFSRDSLSRAIATSSTECRTWILEPFCWLFGWGERRAELRERDVPLDAQRLQRWYQLRGYREADVASETAVDEEGRALVRFAISEGTPILADSIGYAFPGDFEVGDLLDDLPVSPGDPWSTLALDATRDTLRARLQNRGYPYADVLRQSSLPRDQPYRAHVTFEIEPGASARYGEIRVEGIDRLDESTVLRTLPFRSGDPYRADQLFEGQARLFGLEIIRNARVEPDTTTMRQQAVPDSIVPVFVQVSEGDPYRIRGGVGYNTSECANTEARWASRNFLGGGRVVQLRGRIANIFAPCQQSGSGDFAELTWLAAVDFSQPWIFSTRNSFRASVYAERQSVPDIFIRRAIGLDLALVRNIGPRTPLTLSYQPELSSLQAAEELLCSGFLVCDRDDIDILTDRRRLAPVGLSLTRDHANSLLNPSDGYRLAVGLEHAAVWTGSEFRYNRAVVEGTWYSRLTGATVLATRVRGGWVGWGEFDKGQEVTEIVHPQKRFYAGGANSVRGFGQSRLGPRVLAIDDPAVLLQSPPSGMGTACLPQQIIDLDCDAGPYTDSSDPRPIGGTRVVEGNVELRFGLGSDFEFVTFGDFGQVWGAGQRFSASDLEFTPGVGIRYLSPVGPIRLDVGYNFRGSEALSVVTEQIESSPNCGQLNEPECLVVDDMAILYARTGQLAVLPRVDFGEDESPFQLHLSIGQAF